MRSDVQWIARPAPPSDIVERLEKGLNLQPLTAYLLALRGIHDLQEADTFLSPSLRQLPDPTLLKGMNEAVDRIVQAIEQREKIVVYGDYDVDGCTSTTTLMRFFREIGVPRSHLHFFIPKRLQHGYGLNRDCLPEVKGMGCDLMITVDCGITSFEEVEIARELGIDTIIIDHHIVPEKSPRAVAVVNPKQDDCPYPDKNLCAAGLAFNLVIALRTRLRKIGFFEKVPEPNLRRYLDIVALGTVADIVPLKGVNRVFVSEGLKQLKQTVWEGMKALMKVAKVKPDEATSESLGFYLGPRINAAGRMGDAARSVKLLLSDDAHVAEQYAEEINRDNHKRRDIQNTIYRDACALIDQSPEMQELPAIVLGHDTWHMGVVGIVASKLVDRYHRPTVMIAVKDGVGKASCRSIGHFNLYTALKACEEHLIQFGGHAAAAGLSMKPENIPAFRAALAEVVAEWRKEEEYIQTFEYDALMPPEDVTPQLLEELSWLEPFGEANPAPVLIAHEVDIVRQKLVGADHRHIKFTAGLSEGIQMDAISFYKQEFFPLPQKTTFAYKPEWNEWNGRRSIQMKVQDFDLEPAQQSLIPND